MTAARAGALAAAENMDEDARLLEVIRLGHPVLRSVAEPVPEELFASGRLVDLGRDMVRTMIEERGNG